MTRAILCATALAAAVGLAACNFPETRMEPAPNQEMKPAATTQKAPPTEPKKENVATTARPSQ